MNELHMPLPLTAYIKYDGKHLRSSETILLKK